MDWLQFNGEILGFGNQNLERQQESLSTLKNTLEILGKNSQIIITRCWNGILGISMKTCKDEKMQQWVI